MEFAILFTLFITFLIITIILNNDDNDKPKLG